MPRLAPRRLRCQRLHASAASFMSKGVGTSSYIGFARPLKLGLYSAGCIREPFPCTPTILPCTPGSPPPDTDRFIALTGQVKALVREGRDGVQIMPGVGPLHHRVNHRGQTTERRPLALTSCGQAEPPTEDCGLTRSALAIAACLVAKPCTGHRPTRISRWSLPSLAGWPAEQSTHHVSRAFNHADRIAGVERPHEV
jgi:hypothetical protein